MSDRVVLSKEAMEKKIGKSVEYYTHNGKIRNAKVKRIEYHEGLKEYVYVCRSPFGHTLRLTHTEITY